MSLPAAAMPKRRWLASIAVIGALLVLISTSTTIGADTMWLVAMGDAIVRQGGVPIGVPFAAADSSRWVNVPVLGELVFAGVHRLGTLGLPTLQLLVDAALLALIGLGARRIGARDVPTAAVLLIAALGILPSLGVVRAQLLSLVPFALLVLLLRSEHEKPSLRIWLLVPLVALWGNLHGAVLAGVAVAGCYLALSRLRIQPLMAVTTGVVTIAALWMTPAHLRTADYYLGVLGNEAAHRGAELWSAPRLDRPLDVLMLVASLLLVLISVYVRRPLWEYLALAGLVIATFTAARHGVWLILFAAGPSGLALTRRTSPVARPVSSGSRPLGFTLAFAVGLAGAAAALLWSRVAAFEAEGLIVASVKKAAGDHVVLAPEPLVESLAASGVRVWLSNPIDAFSAQDQVAYLDFLSGQGSPESRALAESDVVVAATGSPAALLARRAGFLVVQRSHDFDLMRRP